MKTTGGKPVPGAVVEIQATTGRTDAVQGVIRPRASTDAQGHYRIGRQFSGYRAYNPEPIYVFAEHSGHGRSEMVRITPGQHRLDFTLQGAGRQRGSILGDSDRPRTFAVHVVGQAQPSVKIYADTDGKRYFVEHLLPDTYDIFLRVGQGPARKSGRADVAGNRTTTVDIKPYPAMEVLLVPQPKIESALHAIRAKFFAAGTAFETNAQLESTTPLIEHAEFRGDGSTPRPFTVEPGEYTFCAAVRKADLVRRGDMRLSKLDMTAKPWCRSLAVPKSGPPIKVAIPVNTN